MQDIKGKLAEYLRFNFKSVLIYATTALIIAWKASAFKGEVIILPFIYCNSAFQKTEKLQKK